MDWALFEKLVARHRVEGLVHNGLSSAQVEAPSQTAERISRSALAITRQNLLFASVSARIGALLREQGIAFLFLKGVSLNILAYGTLAIKQGWDIDLAVDPERYLDACALIEQAGFQRVDPGPDVGPEQLPAWLARHKHTIWINPGSRVALEVHSSIVDNPLLLPSVSVHGEQQQVEVAPGLFLPTLPRDELFSYLCIHGSAHAWSRLKWLADLAAFLKSESEESVEQLYRRSTELGAGRTAGQALLLCSSLLALPLRASFREELASDRAMAYLVRVALKAIGGSAKVVELDELMFGTIGIHISHFFMAPGWPYKALEFRRKFMPMADERQAEGAVASAFSPLYRVSTWLVSRARKRSPSAARAPSGRREKQ